jgi:hypothetical protein
MPRTLIWAIPGIVVWAVLQVIAVQWCTGWRAEKAKYGFGAVVLLAWWLPNLLWGERGASEVEQLVLVIGFPMAAIYLAGLLVAEFFERRSLKKLKADG